MSEQSPPPPADGEPKKKRRKAPIIIGVIIIALIIGGIAQCAGVGDEADTPVGSPSPTPSPSEPAPSSAAESPSAAESSDSDDQSDQDPQDWADDVSKDLLTAIDPTAKKFSDTCGHNEWACQITDVSATVVGQLHVREQLSSSALDKDTAELWARYIFQMVGKDHPELDFVIVEDAGGVVAGQRSRSQIPMLN